MSYVNITDICGETWHTWREMSVAIMYNGFVYNMTTPDFMDLDDSIHSFGEWTFYRFIGVDNGKLKPLYQLFFKAEIDAIMAKMILS